jgi:hypothetical protein
MARRLVILFIWGIKMDSRPKTQDAGRKIKIESRAMSHERRNGSAIILAIVLTSLLAIIGVLFLISSRVDSIATSSIADNEDLTLAVDTVITQISQDLAEDITKGVIDPNCYADYPDPCNFWLASLEPVVINDINYWPHITDLYNRLGGMTSYLLIPATGAVIYEHGDTAGDSTSAFQYRADADGDGAPDSMWVQISAKSSSKGKSIYAAVRIIDNGAMLNVNTGGLFNPGSSVGAFQTDINLISLSWRGVDANYNPASVTTLDTARNPLGRLTYANDVIWRYDSPDGNYTPFDISDELEMRYRFLINQKDTRTRLESWGSEFIRAAVRSIPFDNTTSTNDPHPGNVPKNWVTNAYYNLSKNDPNYAYRHIATIYNCDRVITPDGGKMININNPDINVLDVCDVIKTALIEGGMPIANADSNAAQIAANLIDYRDDNNDITVVSDSAGNPHFGFERPCIYISEIAANFTRDSSDKLHRSYAIELYIPYYGIDTINPAEWKIQIGFSTPIGLTGLGTNKYHIIRKIDPQADITINPAEATLKDEDISFYVSDTIRLWRNINGVYDLPVDEVIVPPGFPDGTTSQIYSLQRDITLHKCIRRLWYTTAEPNLGNFKTFALSTDDIIQAHPANKPFTNVGELGQLFYNTSYFYGGTGPATGVTEPGLRIDLSDPQYQQIFKYLTVMDPCDHGPQALNESRIKGRININTAPWFVIAQLPWVSAHTPNYDLARAIVDKREIRGGYKSIGELMADANSSADNIGYNGGLPFTTIASTSPVLITPNDPNDFPNEDIFEKRDLIFDRISNLVTVRSDVFTAYILVRIGQNGPQKRVIAILDRSEVPQKPVKVIAIQQVPDPR